MGIDGITISVEFAFVLGLLGEGVEVGRVLGTVYAFGELVDPVERIVLRVDIGALVLDAVAQVEDIVQQSRAKGEDEQVGDDHFPTRPASARVIVFTFLRHDAAKIELFFRNFAAN